MESVVRFTLRQQVLFNLLFVVLMLVGLFTVGELSVERYPNISFGKATITTFFPGASPSDVESLVTQKIEEALEGLDQVELIRSSSVQERSTITVKFIDDSDYDDLYDELRFRVLSALDELPAAVEPPLFDQIDTAYWLPVISVNLIGQRSNRALTLIAEQLGIRLAQIDGVNEARVDGEQVREFHVLLDPERLALHGVPFEAVSGALRDANLVIPAGDYNDESGEFVVRVDERFRSRGAVLSTIIRSDADGSFVTLGDLVSSAALAYRDPHVINSVDGMDTVAIRVAKHPAGNALDIVRAVRAVVDEFSPRIANEGVRVVLTQDSTVYIDESLTTLGWNMVLGIVLVGLVLWLFMGPRNAGLVSIGIPFSFLVCLIAMWLTGNSLNEITLFSFVLVSGIIVDDAIVVTENIYRHVQQGEPIEQAIVAGTAEVMLPVISATATTVAAFLPMLMMTGSTGEFFALIPTAVTFALLASVFESLLILPLHYLDFGPRPGQVLAAERRGDRLLAPLLKATQRVLGLTLRFRWTSLSLLGVLFAAALTALGVSVAGIAPLIKIQFFPDDYNVYYVLVEARAGTSIDRVDDKVRAISKDIVSHGPAYARSASGFAGYRLDEDFEPEFGHHLGTVLVAMPTPDQRAFDDPSAYLDDLLKQLRQRHGGDGFRLTLRPELAGPQTGKDVTVQVVGPNDASVRALADALSAALRGEASLAPHWLAFDDGRAAPARVLQLDIDEARVREFGLTKGQAASLAAAVLDGRYIGDYRLADEEIDLKLGIQPAGFSVAEQALDTPILEHPSGPVLLSDLVRPIPQLQPSELRRYRGQRSRTVSANLGPEAPLSPAGVVNWVRDWYQREGTRFPGASLIFGGEFEDTQRSFDSLTRAFGLALILIYLILATQFRSYMQPLIILFAVTFAIIGVVFGKLVSQSLFTVNSFIAIVGVTGVVVNDALVLIDFINRRYRAGASRAEAIREGISVRFRPILLTTLTTTLGLLPMALGIPSYSVVWGSMASTFVAGLATATLLTLFFVPVGWDIVTQASERRRDHARQTGDAL